MQIPYSLVRTKKGEFLLDENSAPIFFRPPGSVRGEPVSHSVDIGKVFEREVICEHSLHPTESVESAWAVRDVLSKWGLLT